MLSNFTKGRALGLLALLLIGSFALSSQTWYLVSMSPNDESVTLKSFDGYATYAWIAPLLLVCLAAMATSAITSAATRLVSLWVGALSSLTLTLLSGVSISRQDLRGVAQELETATGIAANHGINGVEIATQPLGLVSFGVFGFLFLFFGLAIFACSHWQAKVAKPIRQGGRKPKDSIALWDEQR